MDPTTADVAPPPVPRTQRSAARIAVFGATGATGRELVRTALERGHVVVAAARDPARLVVRDDRLEVRRADVLDPGSLAAVVDGADAVVSALGSGAGRVPTEVYSAGVAHVLDAMRAAGVRRFVGISAAPLASAADATRLEHAVLFPLLHRFFGGAYEDMRRMEALLAASDLDWTVLRPPRLTDKPTTGRYRTAPGHLRGGRRITRGDLAAAMLDTLDDRAARCAVLGVAT